MMYQFSAFCVMLPNVWRRKWSLKGDPASSNYRHQVRQLCYEELNRHIGHELPALDAPTMRLHAHEGELVPVGQLPSPLRELCEALSLDAASDHLPPFDGTSACLWAIAGRMAELIPPAEPRSMQTLRAEAVVA